VREITTRIQGKNSEVLNQPQLLEAPLVKRRCITDEQCSNLAGMVADVYEEDVDFNFVKIHLLSHFEDHMQRFENI